MNKQLLKVLGLSFPAFFILIAGASAFGSPTANPTHRNVLLITIDTLRSDRLGCYGYTEIATPNIDGLARKSLVFTRAFANTTTTLPSHVNILSGTTPLFHGVHENLNFIVSDRLLTLAEHLKNQGYSTGAFVGAYPLDMRFGLAQGFEVYDDQYDREHLVNPSSLERNADAVMAPALNWLKSQSGAWFLWIHCWDPHSPYDPPEPYLSRYKEEPYDGEVAYTDFVLGKLFGYMEEKGLFSNTLVILTGDHGESLGEHGEKTHGYFAYNSTLWIPLIISFPGVPPGRTDQIVSHIDLFPTICDMLGLEKPSHLQGASLHSALQGKSLPDRPVYFESLYPYYSRGWAPIRGLIHQKIKYIESPWPELYDIEADFQETKNTAPEKNLDPFKDRLQKLMSRLTPSDEISARKAVDPRTRERLASLGYVSSRGGPLRKNFQRRDDVKILLPLFNRTDQALGLHRAGKTEEALKALLEIVDERPDMDQAYINLAAIYRMTGKTEAELDILERGLRALPANYDLFQDYMKALNASGRYEKVIDTFAQLSPREVEHDPEAWNILGTAYAKGRDYTKAIESFKAGLALDARFAELYNNMANAYFSQGLETRDNFAFTSCFELYKKAIEIDPTYPQPYFGLGHAYREAGDLGAAVSCWEQAIQADPEFRPAYGDLALAFFAAGEKERACRLLTEYKTKFYALLPPEEKKDFDRLMEKCRDR